MENFNFEEIKNFIRKVGRKVLNVMKSLVLPIVLIIAIITVLLAGFVYIITLDDGSKKKEIFQMHLMQLLHIQKVLQ